ncbi:hypothetical protein A2G94_00980 [Francisella endosymbiont of Ornithodoros moubata]|nr:hypothetical protein A2G94_00980 [Francisella endosymbiont of Ornithodoros moubata]
MKNKECAISIAERTALKYNLDLLDDAVYLRKINLQFENKRLVFYRVYSFDYNTQNSDDRYRGYIVIRNGRLDDVVLEFEKVDIVKESTISEQATNISPHQSENNIINFDG